VIVRALAILGALATFAGAAPLPAPVGVVAPKGFPGIAEHHASTFLYVTYIQDAAAANAGAGATMLQGDPGIAAEDAHTLGEIGVSSADGRQIVEIGWHVDPFVNHDAQPRLFVFHWVDGQATCYNGCGFVQVSTTRTPGMRVTSGVTADYAIKRQGADWWMYYQGDALGYFPGSLWPNGYSAAGHVQWFGEVAAGSSEPCSEMGNGERGTTPGAATMTNLYLVDGAGTSVPANAAPGAITAPALYSIGQTTPTGFAFGGPGAMFGCCTPQSCLASSAECGSVPDACGPVVACGACPDNGVCGADFVCGPAPMPRDGGDAVDDTGGCCGAGRDARSLVPAALVLLVLRRRRR
jgi:hypothetical protein